MPLPVTALYAGLMGLILFVLDFHVGRERGRAGVSLYHGDDTGLAVAIRRQGNFTEHVPLALILLGALELNGAPAFWLHALGAMLLVARVVHPFGLHWERGATPPRVAGALLTGVMTLVASIWAIVQFLGA
jgi:uncharacterized membrane protein YecN with MAPEG domain